MKRIFLSMLLILAFCPVWSQNKETGSSPGDEKIIEIINKHRPSNGAFIPGDIAHRLGATHVAGKYYFTDEPFIIEGCKKLYEMGFRVVKLWFRKNAGGYPYNSDWNLPENITLKELAQHPYYKACFDIPFSTIALSVGGAGIRTTEETAAAEEKEIYELTRYLLEEYRDRALTFILHNWEGDWIMRGGTDDQARWSRKSGQLVKAVDGDRHTVLVPPDSMERVEAMVTWFKARQRGVTRARTEAKNSKCKVFHAIEANKVMNSMDGIPGIVNYVLPRVKTDMVSWSCYDGMDATGLNLYKGIEYIKKNMRPTEEMQGQKIVFLGEIGIPEQRYKGLTEREPVVDRWDAYIGVFLALDLPYLIQWELYCNEPKNEELRKLTETRTTDEMRGFWLIRPNGTKSFVGEYFDQLLNRAGKKFKFKKSKKKFSVNDKSRTKDFSSKYSNIYELIQGELPSVSVRGTAIEVRTGGHASLDPSTIKEPLIMVNGIATTTIGYINPFQVESIEFIDGPEAAMYGSRGSNGVIIIELK